MAVCLFMMTVAAKAEGDQKIASKVQKVIVFLNGAQVTRSATVNLGAGNTDLVFTDISPQINERSIQVHANGEFTILSVKHELDYLSDQVKTKRVEDLEAAEKLIRDKINIQNGLMSIYQAEENTLMKNEFVKAENTALDVVKLKQALDFQTERLTSIKEKELAVNNQLEALNIEMQKYVAQISAINEKQNATTSNIIVSVSSKAALQTTFLVSYLVNDASWGAAYDIKAKNVNSPLTIIYKANVSQTTGEDWKNIKLTLSTGNPTSGGIKPELNPYYLNLPVTYAADKMASRGSADASLSEVVVSSYATQRSTIPVSVNQVENQTNVEFNIENPYTVNSDGKTCVVEINQVEIKAKYQYYVAPKINTNVFLTAQVTDWSKYNFLYGEANLFFEGTYVGKSVIDTRSLSDTLNLSLGTDRNILVSRRLEKDLSEKQALGSNRKETKSWQIAIKNRKNQKINLLVEDQVPVSQNSAIEVEVQEASGVKPDPLTGKVSWNFLLNSQDDKKLQLTYLVKYPKNQSVIVQ